MGRKNNFWYVNDKEYQTIKQFHKRHQHLGVFKGFIRRDPYHIEIYPNSVGCCTIVVCDVCKEEFYKGSHNIEWEEDVTDYDAW